MENNTLQLENKKRSKSELFMVTNLLGLCLIATFAFPYLLSGPLNMVIDYLYNLGLAPDFATYIMFAIMSILMTMVPFAFLVIPNKNKVEKSQKVKGDTLIYTMLCMGFMTVATYASNYISVWLYELGISEIPNETRLPVTVYGFIAYVIYAAIVPAIFEELVFRKFIIDVFSKWGKFFAVVVSALAFAICHFSIMRFTDTFIVGIVFGLVYSKTKSIKAGMIAHFINNFLYIINQMAFTEVDGWVVSVIHLVISGLMILAMLFSLGYLFSRGKLAIKGQKYELNIIEKGVRLIFAPPIIITVIIFIFVSLSKIVLR